MKTLISWCLLLLLLFAGFPAVAPAQLPHAPANDLFDGRVDLGSVSTVTVEQEVAMAGLEPGEAASGLFYDRLVC